MRFSKYLKEDVVSNALDLPEPEVGGKYPDEKVQRYIGMIDAAMKAMTKRKESEVNDSIVADLRDKKKKWESVDKETKPIKTKQELPPGDEEEDGEPPPEEPEDDRLPSER